MLYHHSNESYESAASNAARAAREKLNTLIGKGRERALSVIEQVQRDVPTDRVAPGPRIHFAPEGSGIVVNVDGQQTEVLHKLAAGHIAEKTGVPRAFANDLLARERGEWGPGLLAHNYNEVLKHDTSKYLLRSVKGELRGFLSNSYRRLDSRPIVDAFASAAQDLGAVPIEGYALDTKIALKALVARVYEPVPNEVLAFGVVLENSDFGNGALSISAFCLRLWCTNYAISETPLRQVHLGRRLSEDLVYSQRTYELDTQTTVSAVSDIVRAQLSPAKIETACDAIRRANDEKVAPQQVAEFLKKSVTKDEAKQINETFASADVVNVPAGQNRWRFSNAISWVANKTEDEERKLDLMKLAGEALKRAA